MPTHIYPSINLYTFAHEMAKSNNQLLVMLRQDTNKKENPRDIHESLDKAKKIKANLIRSLNGWKLVKNKKSLHFKTLEALDFYLKI